jgi:hypothetical protein
MGFVTHGSHRGAAKNSTFVAEPHDGSEVTLTIAKGQRIEGWVGGISALWDEKFVSMILYSVDGKIISENTCVFF